MILRTLLSITDLYAPTSDIDWTNRAAQNFDSALTATQNKRAETLDGADMTLAELGVEQQRLALEASRQGVLGFKTDFVRRVLQKLVELKSSRTVFKWAQNGSGSVFIYEGRFTLGRQIVQTPLEPGPVNLAHQQPSVVFSRNSVGSALDHLVNNGSPQLTQPTQLDKALAPGMLSNRLPSTVELEALFTKVKAVHPETLHITIDSSVAQKPVCVFGIGFSSVASVVHGAASVYGLEVKSPGTGSYIVGLPRARSSKIRPGDGGEAARMIPPSLVRYVEGQARVFASTAPAAQSLPANLNSSTRQFLENENRKAALGNGASATIKAFSLTANRRLLVLAKPYVPTPRAPAVPVASVGSEALRLLTIMMLSGQGLQQLLSLQTFREPYSLADTASMHIRIKMRHPRSGGTVYDNQFGYLDSSGTFVREGMVGCRGVPPQ